MSGIRKGYVMSKRENANNVFRLSDSPLTEYEKEQIALRKNLERLKAERLAREVANSKND
jgi:U3 small nucleolar ribonucleoprotein component